MPEPSDDLSALGYRQELRRSLSLLSLLTYGLVFISPIAPVGVFGFVFNASHGMVPLVYVIGLIAMLFTALSYAEMVRAFPIAGSVYSYASRTLGSAVGFLAGWTMLLDYLLAPALIYVGAAIAVHAAFPGVSQVACVVTTLLAVTLTNYFGAETTARTSFVLLTVQLLILVVFCTMGGWALQSHVAGAHLSMLPFFSPRELTPGLVFNALSIAALSFLGFDALSTLAEEAKGGSAAVAKATVLALCVTAVLFIGQTWLASLFLLDRTRLPAGDATNAAFYNIAESVGGRRLKFLLAVPGVYVSCVAAAMAAQTATARLLFGMARDGRLPRMLARVDIRRRVPHRAIFLAAIVTLTVALALVNTAKNAKVAGCVWFVIGLAVYAVSARLRTSVAVVKGREIE